MLVDFKRSNQQHSRHDADTLVLYLQPGESKTFEYRFGKVDLSELTRSDDFSWGYKVIPDTKSVEKQRTVTEYRQVQKQRIVTKQRKVERKRTVTKQRPETRYKKVTLLEHLNYD